MLASKKIKKFSKSVFKFFSFSDKPVFFSDKSKSVFKSDKPVKMYNDLIFLTGESFQVST